MKKAIALIVSLTSFSVLAAGEENTKRVESQAKASYSTASQGPKQSVKQRSQVNKVSTPAKKAEGISIKRRSEAKKNRDSQIQTQAKSSSSKVKKQRPESIESSTNSYYFSIYDAWTTLNLDYDGDGYFSEFTVSFDVDFSAGYADVYAEMYLSKDGGPWIHFNTTDIFTIYGYDSDPYSVTTFLNYDFPTGYYDVVIDIYEVGYSGLAASAGPSDFYGLYSLPLEDDEHELNSNDTLITYVASEISDDLDRDGFFTALTLEFDIDTFDAGRLVYTEIELTNVDTFERFTLFTQDYQVGNQTEFVDLLLDQGYPAGWYDVEIRIVDSITGQVLANAAQDFAALIQLPLESAEYDTLVDNPPINQGGGNGGGAVVVHESGGGSLGWLVLPMVLLTLRRMKK